MFPAAASLASGAALSLSLILAIGAQNAFVLRQGLRGEHVALVVAVCVAADAILVTAGIAGLGAAIEARPGLLQAIRWGGAAFLAVYGTRALVSAIRGGQSLEAGQGAGDARAAFATVMALTWLNPHVYVDTLVLLGGIGATAPDPLAYGIGAVAVSAAFFSALGWGARLLRPVFARPVAWRLLDLSVALIMWAVALTLVLG
jgi:L-lysine exporter family protein LysE/ArgO